MMVPVRYTLYFWNPPILTPEQEVNAGRQIVMTGGPEAWKKKAPYLPDKERARVEAYASTKRTVPQVILAVTGLLAFLAIAIAAGPRLWIILGVACVTVLPLSLYTLVTARKRYYDWVDKMVSAYRDAEKAAGITRLSDETFSGLSVAPKLTTEPCDPRGRVTFSNGRAIIELSKSADASALPHFMAHDFLERIRRYALHPLAPDQLKADLNTFLDWVGVKSATDIGVEERQQWARGFDQYLMEGRPPTPALKHTFDQFRKQLLSVYNSPVELGKPLTNEMRQVYARLFASDEEIRLAHSQEEEPPQPQQYHELQAANQGDCSAQYNLGKMFEYGDGVPQDYVRAHMWFNLAGSSALDAKVRKRAAKSRGDLATKMTLEQIAEAQQMAREWKPK